MHYLFPAVIALALVSHIEEASAQPVSSLGNSAARSCYQAALTRRTDQSAVDVCNRAFQSAPSTPDAVATHVNRGIVLTYRGEHSNALRDFDEAIRLNPNEPEAFLNKGLLLLRVGGRDSDARSLMNTAIAKKTRKLAVAYFGRAAANERLGELNAAYQDYERAAALDAQWSLPAAELRRFQVKS